jgi:hypothetical protein
MQPRTFLKKTLIQSKEPANFNKRYSNYRNQLTDVVGVGIVESVDDGWMLFPPNVCQHIGRHL